MHANRNKPEGGNSTRGSGRHLDVDHAWSPDCYFSFYKQSLCLCDQRGKTTSYGIIRSQILNMEPFPSINKAYAFVTKEEKQLAIAGISRDQLTEAAAFNVKHNRFPTKNFAGEQQRGETSKFLTKDFTADQQRGETSRFRCSYCDKPGHSKEKCFKLVGYPSSWQNKAKTPNFARQNRNFRRESEHVSSNNAIAESSQSTGKSFNLIQDQLHLFHIFNKPPLPFVF
ncbi:hypothetical protein DKX38_029704 [Salix brachista]|uniref:CCHC-type domain-containing protein n=1 Tax=Salix brachista TaxID=2182728 RepID=A0A5N5J243_9ROSI|nr:hypothetical protein DKX38_029704 [Salix brachista]